MDLKIGFKATKKEAEGKTFEELQAEVRANNEANIQAYLDSLEPEETE